ncbi:MAG: hypothetical protein NC254_10075 [bacterium]|nr:hypothetical protein [bacterium]
MYKLQKILTNGFTEIDGTRHMYYRSSVRIYGGLNGEGILYKDNCFEFFTYFNSFSVEKWRKYTYAGSFYLVLEIDGKFTIDLFGHYGEKESSIRKEWLGSYDYDLQEKTKIILPYPIGMQSAVVAFEINTRKKTFIYDAYYATDIDEDRIAAPYIALATTTFKKESYVSRNIALLKEQIFSDPEYANAFCWNIVDNGRTLHEQTDYEQNIRIFHNKNVGGAGGFARGMIESLRQPVKPTHILLMDDDVVFSAESFKRLYKLLSIIRLEYKKYFVSGAMLKMQQPNIQHEDIGKLNTLGFHEAVKPQFDLNLWNNVLLNEKIPDDNNYQYAAWWFCCIPVGIARLDNLPLPVFVRGDDVEYSIRNQAKFITMNGLCIWHEGFEGKFSAALEYYQVERNELIVRALHSELSEVDVIGHIKEIFWQEIYKYNYQGASLLLDAIEDFLKGPDYFFALDLFEKLQEKREQDNKLLPITEEIRKLIDYEHLFDYRELKKRMKFLYDYTYNGQGRIPNFLTKKKIGIIPYGWGYFPEKQCLTSANYAIDVVRDKYAVYRKDRNAFKRIKNRFYKLMHEYNEKHISIEKEYQEFRQHVTCLEFWMDYLNKR